MIIFTTYSSTISGVRNPCSAGSGSANAKQGSLHLNCESGAGRGWENVDSDLGCDGWRRSPVGGGGGEGGGVLVGESELGVGGEGVDGDDDCI